jgi:hypothetical protein
MRLCSDHAADARASSFTQRTRSQRTVARDGSPEEEVMLWSEGGGGSAAWRRRGRQAATAPLSCSRCCESLEGLTWTPMPRPRWVSTVTGNLKESGTLVSCPEGTWCWLLSATWGVGLATFGGVEHVRLASHAYPRGVRLGAKTSAQRRIPGMFPH